MKDATTVDVCLADNFYGEDLIQEAFRLQVNCADEYEDKEFIIKLTSSQHIVAFYILGYERNYSFRKGMINTYVYIGDRVKCTDNPEVAGPIFASGFFKLSEPARGQYVCLKRYDAEKNEGTNYTLYGLRLYQTPNILEFVQSLEGPSTDNSDYPLSNLITNFANRCNIITLNPIY